MSGQLSAGFCVCPLAALRYTDGVFERGMLLGVAK